MNERIKELRRQVFADTDEILAAGARDNNAKILLDIMSVPGNKQLADLFFEKFAELIVRECMSLMNQEQEYYSKPASYESREYYERCRAKEDAFDDAARIIKNHFGVEE